MSRSRLTLFSFTSSFTLTRHRAGAGALRMAAHGILDIAAGRAADVLLRQAQMQAGAVVLDLRDLSFMDVTGVHVALAAHVRARRAGTRFSLVPGPRRVQRVFEVVGVDRRLRWTQAEGELNGATTRPGAMAGLSERLEVRR